MLISATGNDAVDWAAWIQEAIADPPPYPTERCEIIFKKLLIHRLYFRFRGTGLVLQFTIHTDSVTNLYVNLRNLEAIRNPLPVQVGKS